MTVPQMFGDPRHPYGLPPGTIRGFMSVLICSFFWIFLLLPEPADAKALTAPLAHFFLITLVLLAFASHPLPTSEERSRFLPWLMRVVFVGGSIAVVAYVAVKDPNRLMTRLTPNPNEIFQWPVLLGTISGGFAAGLFLRFVLGRGSELFQILRGWVGVIAMLLLVAETVYQFLIRPTLSEPPAPEAMGVWEGIILGFVSGYFGTRA